MARRSPRIASVTRQSTVAGLAGKLFAAVLLFVAAGVCALVLWAFPRQDRLAQDRDARLSTVEGTIHMTELRHRKGARGRGSRWELEVWYHYTLGGKTYVGRNPTPHASSIEFSTEQEALHARATWSSGAVVTVYYDTADPQVSALDRAWSGVSFLVPFAGLIGLLCLRSGYVLVRDAVRNARRFPVPAGDITRAWAGVRNVCMALSSGAALTLAVHLLPQAYHATVVQPRLLSATPLFKWDLDVHNGPPTPVSKYIFRPAGQASWIECSAWRFGRTGLATLNEAEQVKERLVAAHREGTLKVHHLPHDPSACALTPGHGGVVPAAAVLTATIALCLLGPLALAATAVVKRRTAARTG